MTEVEEHRDLLNEAVELEQRRVEIVAQAIEANVADLLPETWAKLHEYGREKLVEITLMTGVEAASAQRWSERDCRKFIEFVGEIADNRRAMLKYEEDNDDDS